MADTISAYSKTAASNTTLQSISCAEGMAPSDVNNWMRAIMQDLAELYDGTQSLATLKTTTALSAAAGTVSAPSLQATADTNSGLYFPAADTVGIVTGGTKRMEIDDTDVEISTGNLFFGTAGKGVYLGVTSATAANLLDDYETGTYVATVTCTSSGSYTLGSNNTLQYTKIGRKVNISGRLSAASESSPSGGLQVSLPFTAAALAANADIAIGHLNISGGAGTIVGGYCRVDSGVSNMSLEQLSDAGANTAIDKDDVDTVFELFINLTYIAA